MKERVLMVWDFFDGVRSGVALYSGEPHYFDCEFDTDADDFAGVFRLWRIDRVLLALAIEQWQIYRDWEHRFHSAEADLNSHPGNRGQNAGYDEIEDEIDQYLSLLGDPAHRAAATFEEREDQPQLPSGCLREMDVTWRVLA